MKTSLLFFQCGPRQYLDLKQLPRFRLFREDCGKMPRANLRSTMRLIDLDVPNCQSNWNHEGQKRIEKNGEGTGSQAEGVALAKAWHPSVRGLGVDWPSSIRALMGPLVIPGVEEVEQIITAMEMSGAMRRARSGPAFA